MNIEFSTERSDAIRSLLITTAAPARRTPRVLASIALVALGITAGIAVSAGASTFARPREQTGATGSGVAAPAGVTPGQPIISLLGSPVSQAVRGDLDVVLAAPPTGATHVRVSITCLTAGITSWGFDAGGNNPSVECTDADLVGSEGTAYQDFAVDAGTPTLFLRSDDGIQTVVSYQYLDYVETAWGVNARGETFGVSKQDEGDPDLVAVSIVNAAGEPVTAYSRSADLDAFGPEWPGQPSNPAEAVEWQAERDQKYPNGWDIPAYESDGVTQVGVFHIGN